MAVCWWHSRSSVWLLAQQLFPNEITALLPLGAAQEFKAAACVISSVFSGICVLRRYLGKLEEKAVFLRSCFDLLIMTWKLNV